MATLAAPALVGPSRGRIPREAVAAFAAGFLVLAASLGNFLAYHQFPLLRLETLIVALGLVLIAAVYAGLYWSAKDLGRAVAEAALVYFAIDLNSDFPMVAAGAALLVGIVRIRTHMSVLPLLSLTAGAVLLSSLFGLADQRPAFMREKGQAVPLVNRPAILHLILDEHGGIAGISDPDLQKELADFYTGRDFRLFGRAYSRHFHTVNAVPDILNFGDAGSSRNVAQQLDIGRTDYFSELERQGYRVHIYQSEFADFCRYARAATCTRYWSPSLGFVDPLPVPASEKARLIAYKFAALSDSLVGLTNIYSYFVTSPAMSALKLPYLDLKQKGLSGSLAAFEAADRMASDLKSAKPGNAYFAHLLAPHYPYVMSRQCEVIAPSQWEYRRSARPRQVREAAYHEQLRCLVHRLDGVIAAFLSSPAGRDGIIVIHGDHGSRITGREPANRNRGRISPKDYMAGYSTLFAVRAPTITAGLEQRPFAVPQLLGNLVRDGFSSRSLDGLTPGSGQVFLDGPNWTVGEPASIEHAWPPDRLTVHQPSSATLGD